MKEHEVYDENRTNWPNNRQTADHNVTLVEQNVRNNNMICTLYKTHTARENEDDATVRNRTIKRLP